MTRDTREMDFAHHRQLFLTEQGYSYEILDESDLRRLQRVAIGGDWLIGRPIAVRGSATSRRQHTIKLRNMRR